jgi:hypothetical protein
MEVDDTSSPGGISNNEEVKANKSEELSTNKKSQSGSKRHQLTKSQFLRPDISARHKLE